VFAEFTGPFNTLHQPLRVSVVAWGFWLVCALAEAATIALIMEPRSGRPAVENSSSASKMNA